MDLLDFESEIMILERIYFFQPLYYEISSCVGINHYDKQ